MQSQATTVEEYLKELPPEKREVIEKVREVILENLPEGFVEGMQYGMIGYYIPLEDYPDTYNGEPIGIAALASQKRHFAIYLSGIYIDKDQEKWFAEAYKATGKKMDMGKSCVRFTKLEELPLELIGEAVGKLSKDEFIKLHEDFRGK